MALIIICHKHCGDFSNLEKTTIFIFCISSNYLNYFSIANIDKWWLEAIMSIILMFLLPFDEQGPVIIKYCFLAISALLYLLYPTNHFVFRFARYEVSNLVTYLEFI